MVKTKTKKVNFADIEAMEKRGWIATNEWSIKDYTVTMEKEIDLKDNNL